MNFAVVRFLKYSSVGVSTFLFDLLLLYIFTDILEMNYLVAAGVAFLIAVSINYVVSRKFVFKGTLRGVKSGYVNFIGIAGIGLLFVVSSMYVLVTVFSLPPLISRIGVAGITGFWNYLMNLFINFKVAGKR